MITVRTSPAYVNRVRQDWTANGGVYGDGGVYALVPSNDPFAQLGPTLDLTFAGVPNNLGENGPSIDLYLYPQQYQIAAQYAEWDSYAINYSLLPNAILSAAASIEPEKTLFKDTLIGGRALGDINDSGTVTSADTAAYNRFIGAPWLNASTSNDYIRDVLNPYMIANPVAYAAYLTPGPGLVEKTFSDIITFTRASTATYFNSAGTLTSAAVDEARFDYDPSTLAPLGLLIEESRTNSIRNNTMVGAVAGTPGTLPTNWAIAGSGLGTLTQTVVGTGTSNGITYIDVRLNGTTSTTDLSIAQDTTTQIAALTGQVWAASCWLAVVGGSTTNISSLRLNVTENTSAGAFITQHSGADLVPTINSTLTRYAFTPTLNGGATTAFIRPRSVTITFASGVAIDITLRIGLPQLELGAFATSVIPTTTTALTRSADVASVNTLSPWYNASSGTLFAEVVSTGYVLNTSFPIAASIDDGSNNNRITAYQGGSAVSATVNVRSASVSTTIGDSGVDFSASVVKLAGAFSGTSVSVTVNGGSVVAGTTNGMPSGLTTMRLGGTNALYLNALNGYLRRITYYPRRLSNADLQTITT